MVLPHTTGRRSGESAHPHVYVKNGDRRGWHHCFLPTGNVRNPPVEISHPHPASHPIFSDSFRPWLASLALSWLTSPIMLPSVETPGNSYFPAKRVQDAQQNAFTFAAWRRNNGASPVCPRISPRISHRISLTTKKAGPLPSVPELFPNYSEVAGTPQVSSVATTPTESTVAVAAPPAGMA